MDTRARRRTAFVALSGAVLTFSLYTMASAAEFVVVTASRGPIRAEATAQSALVTVVERGTRLEVIGRVGEWYRVLLPPDKQGTRLAGYVQASLVTVEASKPAPGEQPSPPGLATPGARPAAGSQKPSRFTFRGVGVLEYEAFQARNSFDAIFGKSTGLLYGGGAELSIGPRWFVQGRLSHWSGTGERAFVYEGEVFNLGIGETVTMTPIDGTIGYRFTSQPRFAAYAAGGAGGLIYHETSESSDSSDNSSGTFLSFHAAFGVEVPIVTKWLSVAGELQYRGVPGAIGTEGVSKLFGETNLGGMGVVVKFLIGPRPPQRTRPLKPAASPVKPAAPKQQGIK